MEKFSFTITGAKELEAALKEAGPQIATRLGDKAVRAAARVIVKEMKLLVPVQTGALRRSISAVRGRTNKQDERSVIIGFKRPGRRYAHLVEFGSIKTAPKPFMRPALDGRAADALREMQDALAEGILRQEWKRSLQFISQGGELDFGEE